MRTRLPERRVGWFMLGTVMSTVLGLLVITIGVGLDRRINDAEQLTTAGVTGATVPGGAPVASGQAVEGAAVDAVTGAPLATGGGAAPTRAGAPVVVPAASDGRTDRGVTADTIRIAILEPELGGVAALGFAVDLGDLHGAWEAYIAEINAAGGVHGRRLVAHYEPFDPLSQEDMRRACIAVTEDIETFAVIDPGLYYGPAILCITEEHGEPLLSYEKEPRQWYERSRGMYVTIGKSKTRDLRTFPLEVFERGHLPPGAKVGIVTSEFPSDIVAVEDALLPTLEELGFDDYELYVMSTDNTTWEAQIPLSVHHMQTSGVTHMVLGTNGIVSGVWAGHAESRGYEPQYLISDFVGMNVDEATQQMPRSFDGAIGITATRVGYERLGRPQPEVEAACIARYEKITGNDVEWTWPQDPDYSAAIACSLMDVFRDGLEGAGPNLTRTGWSQAVQRLGPREFTGMLGGAFGPGKLDAADAVATIKWHYEYEGEECLCWLPIDEPRPPME